MALEGSVEGRLWPRTELNQRQPFRGAGVNRDYDLGGVGPEGEGKGSVPLGS